MKSKLNKKFFDNPNNVLSENGVICPNCGAVDNTDSLFCDSCKAPLVKLYKNNPNKKANQRMLLIFCVVIILLIVFIFMNTQRGKIIGQWEINSEFSQIYDSGKHPIHIRFYLNGTYVSDLGEGNYYIKNNKLTLNGTYYSQTFQFYIKDKKLYILYESDDFIEPHDIEYVKIN